jgi:hypothetical protein
MPEEPLPQQLLALRSLLNEVDARLARAPAAPVGLEDLKHSVDSLRTSMWAILSAGYGASAPRRVEQLKLRRAIEGLRAIQNDLAGREDTRRLREHGELEETARLLAEQIAALP